LLSRKRLWLFKCRPGLFIGGKTSISTAGQILIGQRLFAAVEETLETAPAGNLELKAFARPISAYEVHGLG
jgi:class 3 adenylate cyclase